MQQIKYNTAEHRKLYKQFVKNYEALDFVKDIEGRVRMLAKLIYESGQGVSRFSCEGHHPTPESVDEGYVMLVAKNRECATRLVDWFQDCSAHVVRRMGWDIRPSIEFNITLLDPETGYSNIIVRSPLLGADDSYRFWAAFTKCFYGIAKHYIAVNPDIKVV